MANPGRGYTKAELEAKLRDANATLRKVHAKVDELNAKMMDIDKRPDETLAASRWLPYIVATGVAAGLFGLGVAFSVILF